MVEKSKSDTILPLAGGKGDRTKTALVHAARSAFGRLSYAKARVIDITAEAGVSLGAFYRYFVDKEDVLRDVLEQFFERSYATTFHGARYDEANPVASVQTSIVQTLAFVAGNADAMKVLWETSQTFDWVEERWNEMRHQLIRRIARAVDRAQQAGIAYDDLTPEQMAGALIGMVENLAYRRLVRRPKLTTKALSEVARQCTTVWVHALFLPSHQAEYQEDERQLREAVRRESSPSILIKAPKRRRSAGSPNIGPTAAAAE